MVKAGRLSQALYHLEQAMGTAPPDFQNPKIDSLEKALEMAMRTIDLASEGPSGKATNLLPGTAETTDSLACPVKLPTFLKDKDHCSYQGFYHTDVTLPATYFLPDVDRPNGTSPHALDFTYLFDQSLENPDHLLMEPGLQIRDGGIEGQSEDSTYPLLKRQRGVASEILIANANLLVEALSMK